MQMDHISVTNRQTDGRTEGESFAAPQKGQAGRLRAAGCADGGESAWGTCRRSRLCVSNRNIYFGNMIVPPGRD